MCWSLPYINMNQPEACICPLTLEPSSHLTPHPTALGCHSIGWTPCITQRVPTGCLFHIWLHMSSFYSLHLPHPLLPWPPHPQVCSLCLSLFHCPAIYVQQYHLSRFHAFALICYLFFSLTYFVMYNRP